jgi:cytoskeletal protein CcmA (bactofilin family)
MSALLNCHLATDEVTVVSDIEFDPSMYFDRWLADVKTSLDNLSARLPDPTVDAEHEILLESQIRSNCDVTFEGVLRFDGYSIGNVRSPKGTLVLTKRGRIEADIEVATAIIEGAVTGNITANERVVLESDARVRGQIFTPALSMHLGAVWDGDCVIVTPAADADASLDVNELRPDPILFQLDDPLFSEHLATESVAAGTEELEEFLLSA